jgi:excisionase family DNA binding protein
MTDIMTAQELSAYLKITTTTIYKLAQQGEIPSFKVGSEWRFKRELIDRWLEKGPGAALKKVLVVDDEASICELYVKALDRKRFMVDVTTSGREAVGLVGQNAYDFIFLDLKMPKMDGVETFKEMKKVGTRALVAIVTAYPESDLLAEAMKLGPLTVILKPFDLAEIQKAVESVVLMTSRA